MVRESDGKRGAADGKGVPAATAALLAFCPDVSGLFSLKSATAAGVHLAYSAAGLVEKSPVVALPVWLWLLRFLARRGAVLLLLAAFVFGLGVLAALDSVLQQRAVGRSKAVRLSSREVYSGGAAQQPLVPGLASAARVCGSASLDAAALQSTAQLQASLAPVRTGTTGSPRAPATRAAAAAGGSPTQSQLQRLIANVQVLHHQVYGKELAPAQWSQEVVAASVAKMCKELGHEYRPEFCATYDALSAKIHELRQTVGIS